MLWVVVQTCIEALTARFEVAVAVTMQVPSPVVTAIPNLPREVAHVDQLAIDLCTVRIPDELHSA